MWRPSTSPVTVILKILEFLSKVLFLYMPLTWQQRFCFCILRQTDWSCQNKLNVNSVCLIGYVFTKHIISVFSVSEGITVCGLRNGSGMISVTYMALGLQFGKNKHWLYWNYLGPYSDNEVWASMPVTLGGALTAGPEIVGNLALCTWQTSQVSVHVYLHWFVWSQGVESAACTPSSTHQGPRE